MHKTGSGQSAHSSSETESVISMQRRAHGHMLPPPAGNSHTHRHLLLATQTSRFQVVSPIFGGVKGSDEKSGSRIWVYNELYRPTTRDLEYESSSGMDSRIPDTSSIASSALAE